MNLKITLGSLGAAFVLGAIFWAGAAYNRLSSIENHMSSIDTKIDSYAALQERVGENARAIEAIRGEIRDFELRHSN